VWADARLFKFQLYKGTTTMMLGLQFANGLAFGIDEALYVTAAAPGLVYRYEWKSDGTLGPSENFADLIDRSQPAGFIGGDGLAVG
jgi:sugar lactone lactonase YvrE